MTHLTAAQFQLLADGGASELVLASCSEHLDQCEACSSKLEELSSNEAYLLGRIRKAISDDDDTAAEPGCQRLIQWLNRSLSNECRRQASFGNTLPMQIGAYQLHKVVGQGGMGIVYRAIHTWMNRAVAVKLLGADHGPDAAMIRQFAAEFEAIGRLDHPNIVRALDAGCESGHAYLAMELLEGLDLSRIRRKLGKMAPADVAEVGYQAAAGLHHAHNHGLIHRDIKPSNLMLARPSTTEKVCVKVLDLGLARFESTGLAGSASQSEHYRLVGTRGYLAPEQAVYGDTVDIRADVYGLGATLMALVGEFPARDQGLSDNMMGLEQLPSEMATLLRQMLGHLPDDRPANMGTVMKRLAPHRKGSDLDLCLRQAESIEPAAAGDAFSWSVLSEQRANATLADQTRETYTRRLRVSAFVTTAIVLLIGGITGLLFIAFPSTDPADNGLENAFPKQADAREATPVAQQAVTRQVARLVLELGGGLDVFHQGDDERRVVSIDQLPEQPFDISWILLANTDVGDAALENIAKLPYLRGITLSYTQVTDNGIRRLGQVETLESLFLYATDVGDEGVEPLTRLPNLQELIISQTRITDNTLARLAGCQTLERLTLKGTVVTGAAMTHVATLRRLEKLDLRETTIQDAALRPLLSLANLQSLELTKTLVTETGLQQLAVLPRLRTLCVSGERISEAAAARLMQSMPRCRIIRDLD